MKIVLIGATGFVGSYILTEALNRNHVVAVYVRDPKKITQKHNVIPFKGDIFNIDNLAEVIAAHDAVISAYNPGWSDPDIYNKQVKGTRCIIDAAKIAGVRENPQHIKMRFTVGY